MDHLNHNPTPGYNHINDRILAATNLLQELDQILQHRVEPQQPELYQQLSNQQQQLIDSYQRLQGQIELLKWTQAPLHMR